MSEGCDADDGPTAGTQKDLERPGLRKLLARCERGEARRLIVWKLDRLTRRTRHLLSLVEDLFLDGGIEPHSISESLDTSTPHGQFVLTLFGGLAQMERELIVERTRSALAYKREQGEPTSHPPLGFASRGLRQRMAPVPEELKAVQRLLDLWRAGRSYRSSAASLNAEGVQRKQGRRWYHTTVAKVVRGGGNGTSGCSGHPSASVDTPGRTCPPATR